MGHTTFEGLVGDSPPMLELFEKILRAAKYKINVLILGESGTGKELIARALHQKSSRRTKNFVPVNCAALGHDLFENELFGHEKGAFTGASDRKKGLLDLADGGTLFLDEIGEITPTIQAKLLRVLERNEFRRVGGTEKIKVDLNLIAATNQDMTEAVATGKFREDLYYRLKVLALLVPPLRERKEDIPALAHTFIRDFNQRNHQQTSLSLEVLHRLMEHHWPGNVRELKNLIEGAAVLSAGDTLSLTEIESVLSPYKKRLTPHQDYISIPVKSSLADAERRIILAHMQKQKSKPEVAAALGIGLRTLYTKLQQYKIAKSAKL